MPYSRTVPATPPPPPGMPRVLIHCHCAPRPRPIHVLGPLYHPRTHHPSRRSNHHHHHHPAARPPPPRLHIRCSPGSITLRGRTRRHISTKWSSKRCVWVVMCAWEGSVDGMPSTAHLRRAEARVMCLHTRCTHTIVFSAAPPPALRRFCPSRPTAHHHNHNTPDRLPLTSHTSAPHPLSTHTPCCSMTRSSDNTSSSPRPKWQAARRDSGSLVKQMPVPFPLYVVYGALVPSPPQHCC